MVALTRGSLTEPPAPPGLGDSRLTAEASGGVSLRSMALGLGRHMGSPTWPGHVTLTSCQAGGPGTRPLTISTSQPRGTPEVTAMPEQLLLPHV